MNTGGSNDDPASARSPRKTERLAEKVAGQIEQEIVDLGWPVGQVLGSMDSLVQRLEVSPAVFREGVRILEHHNVARLRRGPGGGLVVAAPDSDAVQKAVEVYLRYVGVDDWQLFRTRAALELECVSEAARRIDEKGIDLLRETLERERALDSEVVTTAHPQDLHEVIASLTGNPAMTLFVRVIGQLTRERSVPRSQIPSEMAAYHKAHDAIAEAVISGDAAVARHRMQRHIAAVAEATAPSGADLDHLVGM